MNTANRFLIISMCSSLLLGCANKNPTNPQDPYETLNRNIFKINTCLDKVILRPTAVVYNNLVAPPIQHGISNTLNNLVEPTTMVNDLLQGKFNFALIDMTRMLVNSTLGLGGLIDVAKHTGLPYHSNDFGKTFAYWSANKKSAYLMLPFLGPSTIRDTIGLPFAAGTNPLFYFNNNLVTYVPFAVYYVNTRAQLLTLDPMLNDAFDPYAAVRDAYLQRRNQQVIANAEQPDYCRYNPPQDETTFSQDAATANTSTVQPEPTDDFSIDEKTTQSAPEPVKNPQTAENDIFIPFPQ